MQLAEPFWQWWRSMVPPPEPEPSPQARADVQHIMFEAYRIGKQIDGAQRSQGRRWRGKHQKR